jgi:hypothetical protein
MKKIENRFYVEFLFFFLFMPQFKPYWWITLISWAFAILSFTTWYHTTISFPLILRIQLARIKMLFLE